MGELTAEQEERANMGLRRQKTKLTQFKVAKTVTTQPFDYSKITEELVDHYVTGYLKLRLLHNQIQLNNIMMETGEFEAKSMQQIVKESKVIDN